METTNFFGLTLTDLTERLRSLGKEGYRAQQLFKWIYQQRVLDFASMTNLAKVFREDLAAQIDLKLPEVTLELRSKDGTRKFLFDVGDGLTVEAVLIPSDGRLTLCLSSEVGCNMACKFCFTGKQKLKKRLSASDIVGQFFQVTMRLDPGERISNVVFMGMGEPLDNPDAVFPAVAILHESWGLNLSRRKITVSTSGLVPLIPKVSESGARLAVSLNAPNDNIRDFVMPINKKYPMDQLLDACVEHARVTRDRITFEYVLLKDVTDRLEHARELYDRTKHIPCKINLIPFNEHPDSGFERPERNQVFRFQEELNKRGAHALIRKTMGRDIFAACGQLNSTHQKHPGTLEAPTGVLG